MSRRTITLYDRARGARLAEIRKAYAETQPVFAGRLNDRARRLGYPERYTPVVISRIENGSMTFEDATVWISLDLKQRSWEWFVRGIDARDDSATFSHRPKRARAGR